MFIGRRGGDDGMGPSQSGLALAALGETYWVPWDPFLRSHDLVRWVGSNYALSLSQSPGETLGFFCHTICITFVFDTHLLSKHLSS